jgi:MSHA pilin protein MshC
MIEMQIATMRQCGFTLIELIVTMMIVGILAVAALPKLTDQSIFESRGFYDETLAILRYAQKTAVAQRRTVCATFTATQVTLQISPTFGAACSVGVTGPNGTTPYQITAHGTTQFSSAPAAISFNSDGSASTGASIQVNGAANVITVEALTGYVH